MLNLYVKSFCLLCKDFHCGSIHGSQAEDLWFKSQLSSFFSTFHVKISVQNVILHFNLKKTEKNELNQDLNRRPSQLVKPACYHCYSVILTERQKLLANKLSTVSVAQPACISKLSESVVNISGTFHFTRLDFREQCYTYLCYGIWTISLDIIYFLHSMEKLNINLFFFFTFVKKITSNIEVDLDIFTCLITCAQLASDLTNFHRIFSHQCKK